MNRLPNLRGRCHRLSASSARQRAFADDDAINGVREFFTRSRWVTPAAFDVGRLRFQSYDVRLLKLHRPHLRW